MSSDRKPSRVAPQGVSRVARPKSSRGLCAASSNTAKMKRVAGKDKSVWTVCNSLTPSADHVETGLGRENFDIPQKSTFGILLAQGAPRRADGRFLPGGT